MDKDVVFHEDELREKRFVSAVLVIATPLKVTGFLLTLTRYFFVASLYDGDGIFRSVDLLRTEFLNHIF